VDRHRLAVAVENDNLKESAGPVGTDVEVTVALAHHPDGVADCVLDVLVGNPCLRALSAISTYAGYLCPSIGAQVTLHTLGNLRTDPGREPVTGCPIAPTDRFFCTFSPGGGGHSQMTAPSLRSVDIVLHCKYVGQCIGSS